MKKFIKLFLASSLSFGIIWTTLMAFYWRKQGYNLTLHGYLSTVVKVGFTFGFLLAISLMIIERLAIMKLKHSKVLKDKKPIIKTKVEKQIIISITYADIFDRAKEVLTLIGAKVMREDREAGIIIAKTGLSWKSFGENLRVELKRLNDSQTHIRILSSPKVWTTIIDYGKNLENVERFCDEIIKRQ